eukprot:3667741-Pleurochrysis_carterae.AAC.2
MRSKPWTVVSPLAMGPCICASQSRGPSAYCEPAPDGAHGPCCGNGRSPCHGWPSASKELRAAVERGAAKGGGKVPRDVLAVCALRWSMLAFARQVATLPPSLLLHPSSLPPCRMLPFELLPPRAPSAKLLQLEPAVLETDGQPTQ